MPVAHTRRTGVVKSSVDIRILSLRQTFSCLSLVATAIDIKARLPAAMAGIWLAARISSGAQYRAATSGSDARAANDTNEKHAFHIGSAAPIGPHVSESIESRTSYPRSIAFVSRFALQSPTKVDER